VQVKKIRKPQNPKFTNYFSWFLYRKRGLSGVEKKPKIQANI
jgi:hypothetical protein